MDLDAELPSILAGDADAFGRWLAGAERPVRESLRSFAAVLDAEAVLQEALLRVWQVAPRFQPDGRPNGLLRLGVRIARNLAISEVRRLRAVPAGPADVEAALAETERPPAPPDPLLRDAIRTCREQLPARPRQALDARLAGAGGGGDPELAAALGMRLNTFLQNMTRARQLLAECLRRRGVILDVELGA
jgi:DNA-directed RNA polymerase specialized sigma24 family protein